MRTIPLILICAAAGLAAEEWKVPAEAAAVANPVAATPEAVAAGKVLYTQNCQICHGATGKGDGDGAAYLTPKPAALGSAAVAGQSDGAFFWKISTGRTAMPPWKPLLSDQQRWQLVTYVRTLAPKADPPAK